MNDPKQWPVSWNNFTKFNLVWCVLRSANDAEIKKKKKKGEYLISEGLLFVMTRFQHNPLNSILMGPHIEFQVGMMALSHRDFNAFFHFVIWQNQYNIVKLNKIKFFLKSLFLFAS